MANSLESRVLSWLKIPPAPRVPPGEEDTCDVFRAGSGYYTYIRVAWGLGQLGALAGLLFGASFVSFLPPFRIPLGFGHVSLWTLMETMAAAGFLLQLPVTFWVLKLDFTCRFYLLSDRSLRIQEGIWSFHERTFTLANLQQINVRQNPLQKLFGISDIVVTTAGGGGGGPSEGHEAGESLHTGHLRGLDRAEEIRDRLLEQLKLYRDSGLGQTPALRSSTDAGRTLDAGLVDAGLVDAGLVDAGLVDAGLVDAASVLTAEIRKLKEVLQKTRTETV